MTGKRLSEDHRIILSKLLQLQKLSNHEIAWILNIDERTVRRRRVEFEATGQLAQHKDVSKNAEKLKEHHMKQLVEWHKDHQDALLDDMQLFLKTQCGVQVSVPTISRALKKSYGTLRRIGRCARIKSRKQREAEGRTIASEIQEIQAQGLKANSASINGQPGHEADLEEGQQIQPLKPVRPFQFQPVHVRQPLRPSQQQHDQSPPDHSQLRDRISTPTESIDDVEAHVYAELREAHFGVMT
ncbi:hypothetical protein QBC35DRAFT_197572 [Podospora australis]|uniref:Uncharacterized protein n=1 Tax=Podospora australis TaxID=1536484 RepID=A0AAN6X3L3_9PEZI|nr:hypothetical protein QBC35DRAFT_197572 [Podospora australis]